MPPQGPLLGYNNNIAHLGQVYHVQTEDLGTRRPHVITHLFADGGRIVHTTKSSYADLLNEPDLVQRVRQLMKEQHRAMVESLRRGELKQLLVESATPARESKPPSAAAAVPAKRAHASSPSRAPDGPGGAEAPASGKSAPRRAPPPTEKDGSQEQATLRGEYRWVGQARRKTRGAPAERITEIPDSDAAPQTTRFVHGEHGRTAPAAPSIATDTTASRTAPSSDMQALPPAPNAARVRREFGDKFMSGRSLDEVMRAFLRARVK
jgi:hypothetical protein